jgi:hypothetical protein
MTEAKTATRHTPGPWSIQTRKDGLGALPDRNSLEIVHNYANGGGQQIVVGNHTGIDCLNPANAAHIVCCVNAHDDLLAACQKLIDLAGRAGDEWEAEILGDNLKPIRAAIAKATGVK